MPAMGSSHSLPDDGSEDHAKYTNADADDLGPPLSAGAPNPSEPRRRRKKKRTTRVKTPPPEDATDADLSPVVADVPAATTTIVVVGEKPRRKKKRLQTSQEEESAQALLALNKGLPAEVPIVAENGHGDGDGDGEAADPDAVSPPPPETLKRRTAKDRKKKKAKKQPSPSPPPSPSLSLVPENTDVNVDDDPDVDMAVDVKVATPTPVPSPSPSRSPSMSPVADNDATLQHAIQMQHLDEIPDSDRIISQHLAAHMSKHALAPTPVPDLQDVPMDDSQFTALDEDLLSEPALASPRKGKSKTYKRKRTSPVDDANKLVDPALRELDEAAAAAAAVLSDDGTYSKKKKRRLPTKTAVKRAPRPRKPSALSDLSGDIPTVTGGTFTLEERHAIDTHLHQYMAAHDLTHPELCTRVWSNDRKKDDFWESVCGVLPLRSRASIYKHVRRSYHVFEQRAKWTPAEDEELARLVAEKGSSWKDVGEAMGRMGEDCRDRWRNYVKCGEGRGKDRWGEEEEGELRRVLKDVLRGIKIRRGAPDDDDAEVDLDAPEVDGEEDINWTAVSELMGNRRSRIQCRYKWNKMKQQKARQHGLTASRSPGVAAAARKRKLRAAPEDMLTGDHIWVIRTIRDSDVTEERAIDWDAMADHPDCIWTGRDIEKAYKALRSTLPHRRLPLPEILNRLLTELEGCPEEAKALRYQPDLTTPHPNESQPAPHYQEPIYPNTYMNHAVVPPQNPAPVATMAYAQQHEMEMAMVDPALIGQGGAASVISQGMQQDLEKTAGKAILIAQAAVAAAAAKKGRGEDEDMDGEGDTERELRRRLGV